MVGLRGCGKANWWLLLLAGFRRKNLDIIGTGISINLIDLGPQRK